MNSIGILGRHGDLLSVLSFRDDSPPGSRTMRTGGLKRFERLPPQKH
jgi:hypothetical protein